MLCQCWGWAESSSQSDTNALRENIAKPSWELNTSRWDLLLLSFQQKPWGSQQRDVPLEVQTGSKISPKSLEDAQTSTKQMLIPAGMKSQHFRTGWRAVGKRQKHKNHLWQREGKVKPRERAGIFLGRKIIIKYRSNWALVCKELSGGDWRCLAEPGEVTLYRSITCSPNSAEKKMCGSRNLISKLITEKRGTKNSK